MQPGRAKLALEEGRRGEVAGDPAASGKEGHRGIGVRHADRERVELLVVLRAEFLRGGHLQGDRLVGDLHRGDRDLVRRAEVADRFHLRPPHHQLVGDVSQRADGSYRAGRVAGLRPQQHERRHTARGEIQLAGEQGVVDRVDRADLRPLHFEALETELRRAALDEALVAHDHERQEGEAVLLGDADPGAFGSHRAKGCEKHQRHEPENRSHARKS